MNPFKFKTGVPCEKHAKEYNLDHPSMQNNASVCSCSKCNSFECFALRNQGHCRCNQGSKSQPNNKNITNTCQIKSSVKTVKLPETDSILRERIKKEITYEYNNNNNVATVKKHSKYSYNCVPEFSNRDHTNGNRLEISTEKLAYSHSASSAYSRQNFDTNTAKLSAQIMNVSYKDFKESLSYNKSEVSAPKPTKISRYDILKRIKEAYKACSCKVCECLIGKPTNRSEFCKCKPCECNECKALMKSINYNGNVTEVHLGCPCIRCDRQDVCKGVVKKGPLAYCDCDPCDCIKCTDSFTKPCSCQPCECIECRSYLTTKPRQNLVVASMREDVPRAYCQCSPCDCAECVQNFTVASSLRREMGTGTNRPVNCACDTCINQSCEAHDSTNCICETQKRLMRKPVEKDTRDYDIHRATVNNKVAERKGKNKNNTIAMFAEVGNSFPQFDIKDNSCSCGDCECIVCSCKQNTTISVKQKPSKYRNSEACKCSPCECVMCNSSNKGIDFLDHKIVCECNICDCLKCDSLSKPSTSNDKRHTSSSKFSSVIPSNACKCSPCECTDCQKMMYKCTGDGCYCTNCKCGMCTDQTKFINETVYRDRNDYLPLSVTYGNSINDKYFLNKNEGKTCLTPKSQQPDRERTIHINSRQNLIVNDAFSSLKGLNDNPIRRSTQVLITNNSKIKEQKRHQTDCACETHAQSNEKIVVQSYRRASEYESSRSFMSENSSLGLASRKSNVQPNRNINLFMEQNHPSKSVFELEKPCVRSANDNVLINFPVKTCSDDYIHSDSNITKNNITENTCTSTKPFNTMTKNRLHNHPITDMNQHDKNAYLGIIGATNKTQTFPRVDKNSHLISESILQDTETTNVKDLSFNLVTSLKNANERLSILMEPRFSFYHSKLGHSKIDISVPKNENITKGPISPSYYETNAVLQNTYKGYADDLSDLEIDFDKLHSTLQQAKAFSIELTKVLKDYEKANRKLEIKSVKETRTFNSNRIPEMNCKKTNIELNNSNNIKEKSENLVQSLVQEPYSVAYEPEKKYGSHNLNVMTTKPELPETDDYQSTIKNTIQSLPENKSVKVTHHNVDDDINKYISTITRQEIERQVLSKLDHSNILVNEPSSSINTHLEPLTSSCSHRSEHRHKCRSCKTQKNVKGGKKLGVPRSVLLYKRLQLKEALIKLGNATNTRIRHENFVPQSIQCDNRERYMKADETTQHEHNFTEIKPETTSTSTNAVDRHETSRFVDQVQGFNERGLTTPSWSILKKNCLIDSPYMQSKGVSLIPPLLLEVKDTLRAISRQDGEAGRSEESNEVTVAGHGNRALLQLQKEVNKLWESSKQHSIDESESKLRSPNGKSKFDLDLKDFKIASSQTCNMKCCVERAVDCMDSTFSVAILQRQIRELLDMTSVKHQVLEKPLKLIDGENSGGTSTKSKLAPKICCDTLKVKFLGLRRVSDHTVLVKWQTPQDMNSVQGYELLVDGRAVQKILSPTRCMAVVTCLPHIEKVLITIRTLVSAAEQRTHYPSATIVYKTRAK